ncbi:hypothetical protein CHS0354_000138 [Potamilus streckersoni]|uniref:Uncharacterized protein n=1 Tax=Potamilus streckersoni TaxID=2493646 RepID=A0AAE0SY64_9BIVA|nr:hypothetical protein CHS0354_000138 [Potamilus streckersoni]
MWRRINLLFLVLCFFTEDICCYGSEYYDHDNTDKHAGHGGPSIPGMDSSHERPPIPGMDSSHERHPIPGMDSSPPIPDIDPDDEMPPPPDSLGGGDKYPDGHWDGKMLIVVMPLVGVLVLVVFVTCGICILKKCNHDKIKTQNYQDMGLMEKYQIAITTPAIYPDNPPPYSPNAQEGEMKSVPMEFLGYGTGWYAPEIVNMPPSNTKLVDQALQTEPQYL